eukprot:11177260-Lingulodinium_polyedra.AAC.1
MPAETLVAPECRATPADMPGAPECRETPAETLAPTPARICCALRRPSPMRNSWPHTAWPLISSC